MIIRDKIGADVVKNDGIYSKYFTEYAGTPISVYFNGKIKKIVQIV